MQEKLRFLGSDVHAETIAVAVAEPDGEVRSLGTIPNRGESIRKMIKKLHGEWGYTPVPNTVRVRRRAYAYRRKLYGACAVALTPSGS